MLAGTPAFEIPCVPDNARYSCRNGYFGMAFTQLGFCCVPKPALISPAGIGNTKLRTLKFLYFPSATSIFSPVRRASYQRCPSSNNSRWRSSAIKARSASFVPGRSSSVRIAGLRFAVFKSSFRAPDTSPDCAAASAMIRYISDTRNTGILFTASAPAIPGNFIGRLGFFPSPTNCARISPFANRPTARFVNAPP